MNAPTLMTPELPPAVEPVRRIAYRLDEVAQALGVSRRLLERERSAGRFPAPDVTIGTAPLWRPATIEAWAATGGLASTKRT